MHQWGFSAQKPAFRAYEQASTEVNKWLQKEYPGIRSRAKKQRGLILWLDETGIRSQHATGTSFSPKGKKPVLKKTGKRFYLNEIVAFSNKGNFLFMVVEDNFSSALFLCFLNKLIRSFKQKLFLIADAHPIHLAKKVTTWFFSHQQEIELCLLPGYSPELNPVEYFNQDLKTNVTGKAKPGSKEELKKTIVHFSNRKKKHPQQVKQYFLANEIIYTK